MQCRAYRNGIRCAGRAHLELLRLVHDETEVLLRLELCTDCSAIVAATIIAYQEMAAARKA